MSFYDVWIVCGSRVFNNATMMHSTLNSAVAKHGAPKVIFHGAAKGADLLAGEWAVQTFTADGETKIVPVPADWDQHGRGAGPIRNRKMAELAKEVGGRVVCFAFPVVTEENRGTFDMVTVAFKSGFNVVSLYSHQR
jgi:hypothetical protein